MERDSVFDADLTVLHDGERVSFTKRSKLSGTRCFRKPGIRRGNGKSDGPNGSAGDDD